MKTALFVVSIAAGTDSFVISEEKYNHEHVWWDAWCYVGGLQCHMLLFQCISMSRAYQSVALLQQLQLSQSCRLTGTKCIGKNICFVWIHISVF